MRRKLKDKVLLLTGMGLNSYEVAQHLNCNSAYVRATINRQRKRNAFEREMAFMSDAIKILERMKPLEMR